MKSKRTSDEVGAYPLAYPGAKKRFGQNFLTDRGYASRIADLLSIGPSDIVVEIGPGRGAITRLLSGKECKVYALEIDRDLHAILSEEFKDADNVIIVEGDALKFDFAGLAKEGMGKLKIVANLPYNVATPILFRLLDARAEIDMMALMFQKEVADRIIAKPGSRTYGALSIFPQLYCDIRREMVLPPGAFSPRPKIQSAVLSFHMMGRPRFDVKDAGLLKKIVSGAFSQRRKKLSNSLKGVMPDPFMANDVLNRAGIDPSRRAETVSVEEFCRLSDALYMIKGEVEI